MRACDMIRELGWADSGDCIVAVHGESRVGIRCVSVLLSTAFHRLACCRFLTGQRGGPQQTSSIARTPARMSNHFAELNTDVIQLIVADHKESPYHHTIA